MGEPTPAPRWRRRPVLLALVALLVVALPTGGFLAYGAWTRSGEIVYDRGGEVFGADASLPPVADAGPETPAASAPAVPGPASATGSPDGSAGAATPAPAATGKAKAPASTGSTAAPAGRANSGARGARANAVPLPRTEPIAGTYGLSVSGSEKVTFGPFSFCGRDLPKQSQLVVAPARNEPAGSYNFDVRYFPGEAGKHDERHIYRYAGGAVDLTFESATVTCSGVRQGSDISFSPAQRCVPAVLRVGETWSGTGGDADRTEKYTSTVTGVDTLTISGIRVPVFVLDTRTTFTGSESGERTRRWWYAPSLAMPVKWADTTSGGRSGAKYSNEITVTVSSLPDTAAEVLEAGGR
ncbi:hypothetical protein [Sporichthya polymorpha]|uniref:hypothetical protein n=1 Tax=Sporichthya polymorpha TaxID=35751 RepID=UPI00039EFDCF|nr:hypothetical protein [Sporichthya polymorpha]